MSLERYEEVARLAKQLAQAERQVAKRSEAAYAMGMDETPKRRASARLALDVACEARDRALHALHVAVVRATVAARFDDSYYGECRGGTPDYPMMIVRERP